MVEWFNTLLMVVLKLLVLLLKEPEKGGEPGSLEVVDISVLRCLGCGIVEDLPRRFGYWLETNEKAGFMIIAQPC